MSDKWDTQHEDASTIVKVTTEYNRTGSPQTDAIVIDKSTNTGLHISADMDSGKVTERHGWQQK